MSSNAPAAAIPAGEHVVRHDHLEAFFVAALASGGFVSVEPWQDFVRKADNSLDLEWQWRVVVGGALHGYKPEEFMLDMAVPMHGPGATNDPELLDRRGKVARLLGIGQPARVAASGAAGDETVAEEAKVLQLPVAPPPEYAAPEDPNTFPG